MLRNIVALLVLAVIVTGCARVTGHDMTRMKPGMNEADVIATLGNPDGYRSDGDTVAMLYSNRLTNYYNGDHADYVVLLKHGQVVEYGAGEVRTRQMGNALVFVPVKTW